MLLAQYAEHVVPLGSEVLKSVTGSVLPIIGTTFIVLQRGDLRIADKFFVANDSMKLPAQGILGNPFLKANKAVIKTEENKIELRGRTFKMLPMKEEAIISLPKTTWTCNTINVDFTRSKNYLGPGDDAAVVSTIRVYDSDYDDVCIEDKPQNDVKEVNYVSEQNDVK